MIRQRITVLTCLCALLAACPGEETDLGPHSRHSHPNGLTIDAPDEFAVSQTAAGFRLRPATPIRAISDTVIELREAPPEPDAPIETRFTKAGVVAYTLQQFGGGSGGDEYELRAWRPHGERWIVVTAVRQAELGEPGFPDVWRLLETAAVR